MSPASRTHVGWSATSASIRACLKDVRARERALSEQAELAYEKLTARWQKRRPQPGAGAATGERL